MQGSWRSVTAAEQSTQDADAALPFGHFAPNAVQRALIALARARGWHRLYWHTDEGNATARKLYDSYVQTDGHVRYRLTL